MERGWRRVAIKTFPSLRSNFGHPQYDAWELLADLRAILEGASESSSDDVLEKLIAFARWCRDQRGIRNHRIRHGLGDGIFESLFDFPGDWALIVSFLSHDEIERYEHWWWFSLSNEEWRVLRPLLAARIDALIGQRR